MKYILFFACFFSTYLFAEENHCKPWKKTQIQETYGYVDFGAAPLPIPLPSIGIGVRHQYNRHGFDASVQIASLLALKANLDYLHYFCPNYYGQTYCGFGLGVGHVFDFYGKPYHSTHFLAPQWIIGREWRSCSNNKRFVQLRTNFPVYYATQIHSYPIYSNIKIPLIEFSYGVGF